MVVGMSEVSWRVAMGWGESRILNGGRPSRESGVVVMVSRAHLLDGDGWLEAMQVRWCWIRELTNGLPNGIGEAMQRRS